MADAFQDYQVWRRSHVNGDGWIATAHRVRARSDKEAQRKMRQLFNGAAFHSMALVALPLGTLPDPSTTPLEK